MKKTYPNYGIPELEDQTPLTRELYCFRNQVGEQLPTDQRNENTGLGTFRHFFNAFQLMFPPPLFEMNKWSARIIYNFVTERRLNIWGCSSSTKTTTLAFCNWVYFIAHPYDTSIVCCSTTTKALEERIWKEILVGYQHVKKTYPEFPIKHYKADREIVYEGPVPANHRGYGKMRGVAVQMGSLEEAKGNIIGSHNRRVILQLDEAPYTRPALVDAESNLRSGTVDFKLQLIGNPMDPSDLLGIRSEPPEGYKALWAGLRYEKHTFTHPDTGEVLTYNVPRLPKDEWVNSYGKTIVLEGITSPAIEEPQRLHFMKGADDLVRDLYDHGPESPRTYEQTYGIMPPENVNTNPFTYTLFNEHNHKEPETWSEAGYYRLMAFDPSFSTGGDAFKYVTCKLGYDLYGKVQIVLDAPQTLRIEDSGSKPLEDYSAEVLYKVAKNLKIPSANIVCDVSGNHRPYANSLGKLFPTNDILMLTYQSKATKHTTGEDDLKQGEELYANLRAQMYYLFRKFYRVGMIYGVTANAQAQFCNIRLKTNQQRSLKKIMLESKAELKGRTGKSTDEPDCIAMLAFLIRTRFGVNPGINAQITPTFNVKPVDGRSIQYFNAPKQEITPSWIYEESFEA